MRVHIMGVLTPVGPFGQQENLRLLHVLHTSLGFKASWINMFALGLEYVLLFHIYFPVLQAASLCVCGEL